MKKTVILFIFFIISCSEVLTKDNDIDYTIGAEEEVWVCYNEQSELHNQICEPECLVSGDPTTFCWVLEEESYCNSEFSHLNICSTR